MGAARVPGTAGADFEPYEDNDPAFTDRLADVLADQVEELLRDFLDAGVTLTDSRLRSDLSAQTQQAHPVKEPR
ncbi:MAG: hypothetical protein ACRDVZ_02695 [Jiangellaceae bacterium]